MTSGGSKRPTKSSSFLIVGAELNSNGGDLASVAKPDGKRDIGLSADAIFGVRKLACALIYQRLAMQSDAAPKQSGSLLPHSKGAPMIGTDFAALFHFATEAFC